MGHNKWQAENQYQGRAIDNKMFHVVADMRKPDHERADTLLL